MIRRPPRSTLFPTRRSSDLLDDHLQVRGHVYIRSPARSKPAHGGRDRKSTRLNSSHMSISYAVFCLKKKNISILVPCLLPASRAMYSGPAGFAQVLTRVVHV